MWFLLKKKWFWLTLLVIFAVNVLYPVRYLLFSANFLFNTHLLVLTNEAELRPCGGFVTAYGKFRVFPPKLELKNVYALKNAEFGEAPDPINQVANKLRFWDLGTNPDLQVCTDTFLSSAKFIDLEVDDVILLDILTVEKITQDKNLFSTLTRLVADTDRHDEESLKNRKSPLISTARKVFWNILLKPWEWAKISRNLFSQIENGNVYIPQISPQIKPESTDFAVYEWNLGGGKSSRFLNKKLEIWAYEVLPQTWKIRGKFTAEHLGQYDEPLSQGWKGIFELKFPSKFKQDALRISAKLSPGEVWEEEFNFDYQGELQELSIFNQRGQKLFLDLKISLFGQQSFADANFENHENVGIVYKELTNFREKISWKVLPDKTKPFLTLHEWGQDREIIPEKIRGAWSDFFRNTRKHFNFAEIHFSEPVYLTNDSAAEIIDKNFENKGITDNPEIEEIFLFPDNRTALLGFWQHRTQPNERFAIKFRGIFDYFDNEISDKSYTIIDRFSQ